MPRTRTLAVLVALLASCEGCPEESGVSTLSAAFSVAPASVDVSPLWAGHPRSVTLTVESHGEAPLLGLLTAVHDVSGPVEVTAALDGDALGPGASLALTVVLSAPAGSFGPATASVVVDAGSDGQVVVPLTATVVTPPSCDDGNPCTSDRFDPTGGSCVHTLLDDGAACDDGSACTTGDACVEGRCLGEAVSCADGVECTVDACDPAAGCVFEPLPSRCDDADPCTDDVCAPFEGCSNPPLEEGALCHFDGCAEIGLCFAGECVLSEVPDGMPCEDGDACTVEDTCQDGECVSGPEVGVGAAPPLLLDPVVGSLDLCRGPGMGSTCFGVVDEPGLERVLAVDRDGDRVRVVWQGGYADSYGAPCDPTDALFEPLALDPPDDDRAAEEPVGGALPESLVCSSGVYLTTLSLAFGFASPTTTQLTSARGPAAAAFVPDALSTTTTNAPGPGAAEDPAPPPPLLPESDVVIVHPDFLRASVWIEERDENGMAPLSPVRHGPWSFLDEIAGLAVAVDAGRVVVAVHGGHVELPGAMCDGPGCDVVPVPLWVFAEPRNFGDGGFDRVLHLPRAVDVGCAGVTPGALPLEVRDLEVHSDGGAPRVSLHMSASVCGDVAPGTLGVPDDAPRPWASAAWSFEVDPSLSPDVAEGVPPLGIYAASNGIASFRTTPDGGAVTLRYVAAPCDCVATCAAGEADGEDCACLPVESTCFDTVVDRTVDVESVVPEVLLTSAGVRLEGQTVPLVVEGELRVATLLGPHLELLGTDENGVLSRIVAPAPADSFEWDLSAPLRPGPPESDVVVGRGHSPLDPVFPPPRRALVQVFGCGFGEAVVEGACLEDGDCDEGLRCDRSVCLPGPGCAESNSCDLCWGRCAEPLSDDDGGAPDGGSLEDSGSFDDSGPLDDSGLLDDSGSIDDGGAFDSGGGDDAG